MNRSRITRVLNVACIIALIVGIATSLWFWRKIF